jgi:hypothetical protein
MPTTGISPCREAALSALFDLIWRSSKIDIFICA